MIKNDGVSGEMFKNYSTTKSIFKETHIFYEKACKSKANFNTKSEEVTGYLRFSLSKYTCDELYQVFFQETIFLFEIYNFFVKAFFKVKIFINCQKLYN
jgi:hypothetical protein